MYYIACYIVKAKPLILQVINNMRIQEKKETLKLNEHHCHCIPSMVVFEDVYSTCPMKVYTLVPCPQIEHTFGWLQTSSLLPGAVHFQTAHPKLSKSTINNSAKLASWHSEFQKQKFPKIKLDRVKENRICKKDTGIENTLQQHL